MKMKSSAVSRIWVFYGGVTLVALFLIAKLFFVQIVHGEDYKQQAERQYVSPSTGLFDRGSIFFTKKDGDTLSAAMLKSGVVVAINPSVLENSKETFEKLNSIIDIDSVSFFEKARKKDDPYEVIKDRVDESLGEVIRNLEISGIIIAKDRWRFYPAESMAAQVLGFVGYKGNTLTGRYGLERYYNDVLERDDPELYVNFFAEIFANISSTLLSESNKHEGDIITSIEPTVQGYLEDVLEGIQEEWNSESVGGVVIDPKTGAIYAMGSIPSFNPNTFNLESSPAVFSNPMVEDVYEMGSIIKPITMASGLDANAVKAITTYDDKGTLVLDGKRIGNYDGKARGVVSMQEVLNQSLNTGAVFVMQKLGKEKFKEYFLSFGIGEETGIDLPNEVPGLVSNFASKNEIEYATASFGQGIAMTPIATVRALSALGNGGLLITPHVATAIDYHVGGTHTISPLPPKRVISSETSEEITRMLVKVVDEALLDGTVALPNYSIAAKTGTAQIANKELGGYYDDRYLHSFFGYFPAYDPKFLVFLYIINPKEVRYASQTLTHPFMDMTKFLINYYEISPDR